MRTLLASICLIVLMGCASQDCPRCGSKPIRYKVTLYGGDKPVRVWRTYDRPSLSGGYVVVTENGRTYQISGNIVIEEAESP